MTEIIKSLIRDWKAEADGRWVMLQWKYADDAQFNADSMFTPEAARALAWALSRAADEADEADER